MKRGLFRALFIGYSVSSVLLFLYSYTQVDLGLTLTRVSVWQKIQQSFQSVGYFQRPLSATMYVVLLTALFALYACFVHAAARGKVTMKDVWVIIGCITLILVWSYPAFSYDAFNYMFTAKTVLVYHKNPYTIAPIAFGGVDPWLSFLHWTHLPSAYTPLWIALTLPAYIFGFRFFLLTMWNMKILVAVFYLLSVRLIGAIMEQHDRERAVYAMVLFGLNPLVIVESLVSAHNDIVMMAIALFAVYLYSKKKVAAFFVLSVSVALKLMTGALIPVFLFGVKKRINVITASLVAMCMGLAFVLIYREFLPWYLVWVLPFVALTPRRTALVVLASALSLGLLLRYAPFLYYGHWDDPVPALMRWVTWMPIIVSGLYITISKIRTWMYGNRKMAMENRNRKLERN